MTFARARAAAMPSVSTTVIEIEPRFLAEEHDHEHDKEIGCLTADRPLDPDRFIAWISKFTQEIGTDINRMKGITAMKDDDQRFVI